MLPNEMDHEKYMRLAIEVAQKYEREGGLPIGAVLVKDGEVLASGGSTTWVNRDPSGHGETNCIRNACKALDTTDLSSCVLYGTIEPCGMCLSCSAWARLSALCFGAYREDVAGNEYEVENWSAEDRAKRMRLGNGEKMVVKGGILRKECAELLAGYKDWSKRN